MLLGKRNIFHKKLEPISRGTNFYGQLELEHTSYFNDGCYGTLIWPLYASFACLGKPGHVQKSTPLSSGSGPGPRGSKINIHPCY